MSISRAQSHTISPINELARFDYHPVTHVAAFAIRYQRLLRFRIEPFLIRLADRRLDLDKASAEFASLLQEPSYRTAA